ncbi:EexN family lipoprotein (plasmid) [Rhizobium sp. TH2]|uniref:EexN family lipoprotein n=1 Tax=Rhizobium sp. TH2 TaxID=2775403 RepID=UPI0021572901|nr:EexN family lipoprotein [Rhizobium sp. TH2]UVC12459.1 EexN family lipoprotein [Rhizobium sp. TH2]
MRQLALYLALLVLSGCSEQPEVSYTVDELVADKNLLSELIDKCRNNPGELRNTANCRNAEAADGKLRLEQMRQSLGG